MIAQLCQNSENSTISVFLSDLSLHFWSWLTKIDAAFTIIEFSIFFSSCSIQTLSCYNNNITSTCWRIQSSIQSNWMWCRWWKLDIFSEYSLFRSFIIQYFILLFSKYMRPLKDMKSCCFIIRKTKNLWCCSSKKDSIILSSYYPIKNDSIILG